jgi:competence protein ComEA
MEKEKWWKDYILFSRKERIGILVMVFIIISLWFLPAIVHFSPGIEKADSSWVTFAKMLSPDSSNQEKYPYEKEKTRTQSHDPPGQLFYFDPNLIDAEKWQQLGIKTPAIRTIRKFLGSGGSFRRPEDLSKIYNLNHSEYERLRPFIRISEGVNEQREQRNFYGEPAGMKVGSKSSGERSGLNNSFNSSHKAYGSNGGFNSSREGFHLNARKEKVPMLDVNMADSAAFESLPGIGTRLAQRIIKFREKLGGFYSADQVGETFGLPDSTFKKIRSRLTIAEISLKKIDINKATRQELKEHPYLGWNLANAIAEYRIQHGNFNSIEQLKAIPLITEEKFNRLLPYLKVQ